MTENIPDKKDLHFKGQYTDETMVAFFRSHWITMLPHIIMHFFLVVVVAVMLASFPDVIFPFFKTAIGNFILPIIILLYTYTVHRFFIVLVNHFLNMTIITNLRVVELQKAVFIKDLQISLDMGVIQDIKKEQKGIWENILHFGSLIIMMSSSDVHVIRFVPNPNFHFRLINRIKLEYLQKQLKDNNQSRPHDHIGPGQMTFSTLVTDATNQYAGARTPDAAKDA